MKQQLNNIYNITEIRKNLEPYFRRHFEIDCAYVFGSVAKRRTNSLSDIDIAVLISPANIKERAYHYGYKACLVTDMMKLLKTSRVDLVILNSAPVLLQHRVVCTGRLIYSRNEKKRIALQTAAINKHNDRRYLQSAATGVV